MTPQITNSPVEISLKQNRLVSIDLLRGLVMVLMAIDHVRLYGGMPAGGPEPALFFTRWITHFCVSGFVFFAGVGIYFQVLRSESKNRVSRFLLSRGFLLVILELTLIRFFWTFNLNFSQFTLAGVIWMLGWCMVLMAAIIRLPFTVIAITGIIIVCFQQLFAFIPSVFPASMQEQFAYFWNFFYPTDFPSFENFAILYTIIPWIGVMACGYAFGKILTFREELRNKFCLWVGITSTILFIVIGSFLVLNKPPEENQLPFLFRLLNQNKYPASQLFLLMTLGPLIALVPLAEKSKGITGKALVIFGRVPLFYYILHILLIHIAALIVNLIRSGFAHQEWYTMAPFYTQREEGVRWNLGLLYLVFFTVIFILYFLCRYYADYKVKHPEKKWLKYF